MTSHPDTRLPFRGRFAFDRNNQKYIAFKTQTDAMLASLVTAYRLAPGILSLVLALVRHPDFRPSEITLSSPEDVWTYGQGATSTAVDTRQRISCCDAFPRVIFEEVVDILQTERRTSLHFQRDTDGPMLGRIKYSDIDSNLRNMSLVCKSWTARSQKALGKVLCLQDMRKEHIVNALSGPLFGKWTREAIIFRHNRELDDKGREALLSDGNEVWHLMSALFARAPNICSLSLCTDWFEMPLNNVVRGLSRMSSLVDLRIVMAGDITPLLGAVCKHIRELPHLQHLSLQFSGKGSAYTSFVSPSELPAEGPGQSFERLSLKIGSSNPIALRYIAWLTQARSGENEFKLKSLALDLSGGHISTRLCVEALQACFHHLEVLWISVTSPDDGIVDRLLRGCNHLKRLTLVMKHNFVPNLAVVLPALEQIALHFTIQLTDSEVWDTRIASLIRDQAPQLNLLLVRPSCFHGLDVLLEELFSKSRQQAKEQGLSAVFQVNCTCH